MRRRFLQAGLALATLCAAPSGFAARADSQGPLAVLGGWKSKGQNFVGVWHPDRGAHGLPLNFRAHEVLVDPRERTQAVVIALRPGRHLLRFDYLDARPIVELEAEMHRNFNGHAVFSRDGSVLYTAENNLLEGGGVIGVRDAATLVKQAELPAHGLGPHSLLRLNDDTLLVAVAGVLSIPKPGQPAPHAMRPSLVRIDPANGRLLGEWRLADPHLSIRHLCMAESGLVGAALQTAHPTQEARNAAPVLAVFDGRSLTPAAPPPGGLGGYAGDIAAVQTPKGERFVLGCGHANVLAWYDSRGRWIDSAPLERACAVAAHRGELLSISEKGQHEHFSPGESRSARTRSIDLEWENHMVVLG